MDDNKDLEKEQKQQELDQASQKTAHVVGKGLSTYYGGEAGGQIYDLVSQTKQGQDIENALGKALQRNPLDKAMIRGLDESGALDAADKAIDMADGDPSDALKKLPDEGLTQVSDVASDSKSMDLNKLTDLIPNSGDNTSSGDGDSEGSSEDSGNSLLSIMGIDPKKMKMILIAGIGFLSLFLVIIIMIASSVLGPVQNAKEYVEGLWNGIVEFFTYFSLDGFMSDEEQEKAYYEELYQVQNEFNDKYGICIDINLITASLTVGKTFDESLSILDQEGTDENNNSYSKMKQYIEVLAKMQIKTKNYEYDGCSENESPMITKVTDPASTHDSSTAELVALHDTKEFNIWTDSPVLYFFKTLDAENNYEYYLYKAPLEYKRDQAGNIMKDNKGNPITTCSSDVPDDEYVFDVGTYDTAEDAVFYWNLVNSFIPDYYKDDLPKDEPARTEKIKEIAEEIYLLYEELGPSQSCGTYYVGPSALCPNGITITGTNAGVYDFEEYIAGVVSREAYTGEGMEALKAQAVAARTYALNLTNYCQKSIENSTNNQTFTRDINDRAREAANATSGEILINRDGKVFSSQYDSFCYDDKDCPDATRNSDGTYSVTYTKVPYGEKHTVTLSDSSQFGRITHGQGHARGMSQLVSYQLAKEGKSYKEILSYFYSDGVEISKVVSSGGNTPSGTVNQILAQLFPAGLPASNEEASKYMTTVSVPIVDIDGNRSSRNVTLHREIAGDFVSIMTEIANAGFPIKDVGCYNWRSAAASSSRSHHSYGVACDLNANENYMIKNGQVVAGSYYRPGDDPYSFPANGVVVRTFAKYGWGWGGTWSSSKDYMHFSLTNR